MLRDIGKHLGTQAGVRVRADAQRVAAAVQAVVEAPSMRTAFDKESQVQAGAVIQATTNVTAFDRPDSRVRLDEVVCHAGTPKHHCDRFCGSCRSSCNVNSETGGRRGTFLDKKKAPER